MIASVSTSEKTVTVLFKEANESKETPRKEAILDFVVDFDYWGNPIGIEIINLKNTLGETVLNGLFLGLNSNGIRISYDDDSDAFYVSFSDEKSLDQMVISGKVFLNSSDNMTGLEFELS